MSQHSVTDPDAASSEIVEAGPGRIGPDDARYGDLVRRGVNKRFVATPDYVRLARTPAQVVTALQEAVREGRRVVARSGGHCLEGFVDDPGVRVIIDTSLMRHVGFDERMQAFVVEAGATLGEVYRTLGLGWGVTIPAGESPAVGTGGHFAGGAFGFLCRQHGLAADHLHAVEVAVVDADGRARLVVATRDPSDPQHDLWWGLTGAGGGNFGIVTRYWFRTPGAAGRDPSRLLPAAPASVTTLRVSWPWEAMDETRFARLTHNFGAWCGRHADPESAHASLYWLLLLKHRQSGSLDLRGMSIAGDAARRQLDEQFAAIAEGIGVDVAASRRIERSSWLAFALNPFPELFNAPGSEQARVKLKDAFLREPLTDAQVASAYRQLTRDDVTVPGGVLGMVTYGGKVNTVASDATASAQRDAIMSSCYTIGWIDPAAEAESLAWVRAAYGDLFAATGGVPAPGGQADGAMINHADADLADPGLNQSGVPWHTLYFKDNYPRLQRVKARWDPSNVFHHALAVRV